MLVYDVEIFKYNSMVVFKDLEGKTVRVFSSSLDGLGELVDKGLVTGLGYDGLAEFIEGKTLIGFNNHYYDDYVLWAMTRRNLHKILYEVSQNIIKGNNVNLQRIENTTLDCFQQIDVSKPSLKKIEGNMGVSIIESSVPFDIDRELTPEENLETFKYCEYDVEQTLEIYNMRKQYFKSKETIIDMMEKDNLKKLATRWNTTSIVGNILKPKYPAPHRCLVPEEMFDLVPEEVVNMWNQIRRMAVDFKFDTKKVIVSECGIDFEFGWGGLHGVPKGTLKETNVKLADCTSMYPNILININGLTDKTEQYREILTTSTRLKYEGRGEEREPYKLILKNWG